MGSRPPPCLPSPASVTTAVGSLSLCIAHVTPFRLLSVDRQRSSAAAPTLCAMASSWVPRFFQAAGRATLFPRHQRRIWPSDCWICCALAHSSSNPFAPGLHGDCRGRTGFKSPVAIPASLRIGGSQIWAARRQISLPYSWSHTVGSTYPSASGIHGDRRGRAGFKSSVFDPASLRAGGGRFQAACHRIWLPPPRGCTPLDPPTSPHTGRRSVATRPVCWHLQGRRLHLQLLLPTSQAPPSVAHGH
jgi:hypothetical protein